MPSSIYPKKDSMQQRKTPDKLISMPRLMKHLALWLIPYSVLMVLQLTSPDASSYNSFSQVTAAFSIAAAIVYGNIYLCKNYFFEKRFVYFLGITLLYSLYVTVIYFLILKPEISEPSPKTSSVKFTFVYFTLFFLVVALLSFVYWAVNFANNKTKELLATQLQLQQFSNDKINAEKKFLQSQINPHFLYNTLNYFYSKSLPLSEDLAESILLLSDIMRYSLEIKENDQGMSLLQDEVTHINNIIRINQYRFSNKLQIKFLLTGQLQAVCLVPLILITFVENAFKHAELLDSRNPLVIKLDINHESQQIVFSVYNKKKNGPKEIGKGIGLDNAERRLKYLYADTYSLEIREEENFYNASLSLPLYKDIML